MSEYEGDDRRAPEKWKINKEVGVVDVITIVSALLAVVYSYTTLDKRVAIVETAIPVLVDVNARQDAETHRIAERRERQMEIITNKLDRLIERK